MQRFVFPAIIEMGEGGGYGLFFPDLPGCVTAADTLNDLADSAREALELHLGGMIDANMSIPAATPLDRLPRDPDIREAGVILVEATPEASTVVRLTLPESLLSDIDDAAKARGITRDAIIAESAEALLKAG